MQTSNLKSVLTTVRTRIGILQAEKLRLNGLLARGDWSIYQHREVELDARRIHGELCGLAYAEGALEAQIHISLQEAK